MAEIWLRHGLVVSWAADIGTVNWLDFNNSINKRFGMSFTKALLQCNGYFKGLLNCARHSLL